MSGTSTGATLLAALVSGSALPWLFRHGRRLLTGESGAHRDVLEAEARKISAEADNTIETRLWREISRLDRELNEVRIELATVKSVAADEKTQLETENKRLRQEVGSLRRRVCQLEEIIKTRTTPEDMMAQLAEIDRKTAEGGAK